MRSLGCLGSISRCDFSVPFRYISPREWSFWLLRYYFQWLKSLSHLWASSPRNEISKVFVVCVPGCEVSELFWCPDLGMQIFRTLSYLSCIVWGFWTIWSLFLDMMSPFFLENLNSKADVWLISGYVINQGMSYLECLSVCVTGFEVCTIWGLCIRV